MSFARRLVPVSRAGQVRLAILLTVLIGLAYANRQQCLLVFSRAPALYNYLRYPPREGDVVFQSLPHADLVDAIEGITHSPYSHCGVVLLNQQKKWVVIESIGNVHETSLLLWIFQGRGARFAAYRPAPQYAPLIPKFKEELIAYSGFPYDFSYDMSKPQGVYCSDLVYLAFQKASGQKLGRLEKLGDLDWKPYRHFIESDANGTLPLNQLMITPASLARASQLIRVY